MLTFKQCGQCKNIVYCEHTKFYNTEIEILMKVQAAFQTSDVMVTCIYFEQETNLPRTFKEEIKKDYVEFIQAELENSGYKKDSNELNEAGFIGACLREEVRELKESGGLYQLAEDINKTLRRGARKISEESGDFRDNCEQFSDK